MDVLLQAVEMYLKRQRVLKSKDALTPKAFGTTGHIEKLFKLPAGSISTALKKENLPLLINSESVAVQDYLKKHLLKETNHATKQ